MKISIRTKRQRAALAPRPAPYFETLGRGEALGFRAGPDTWIARWKDHAGRQHYEPLRDVEDFDAAVAAACAWFEQISGAGAAKPKRGTVRDALDAYIAWLKEQGRTGSASLSDAMYRRSVDGDAFAAIQLEQLTQEQFRHWRARLLKGRAPTRGKNRKVQSREPQSVNRIVRQVVAGLNWASKHGHVGNVAAWTVAYLHTPVTERRTDPRNLLTPEQREQIKALCAPIVRDYLRGLEETGARPSEVAALTAKQFDPRSGGLVIGAWKGRPVEWRERQVPLSTEGAAFFAERVKLHPEGPLFPGVKGGRMPRKYWAEALRLARRLINASAAPESKVQSLVAYSFRHARISELLQVFKVDVVTVAKITGTSVQMIEATYHHQIPLAIRPLLDRRDTP